MDNAGTFMFCFWVVAIGAIDCFESTVVNGVGDDGIGEAVVSGLSVDANKFVTGLVCCVFDCVYNDVIG